MNPAEYSATGDTIETSRGTSGLNAARTTGASFLIFVGLVCGVVFAILLIVAEAFGAGASMHRLWILGFIASVLAVAGGVGGIVRPRGKMVQLGTTTPTADLFAEFGIPFENPEPEHLVSAQSPRSKQVARAAGAGIAGAALMVLIAFALFAVALAILANLAFGVF